MSGRRGYHPCRFCGDTRRINGDSDDTRRSDRSDLPLPEAELCLVPSTACITTRFISHDMVKWRSSRPRWIARRPFIFPPCPATTRAGCSFIAIESSPKAQVLTLRIEDRLHRAIGDTDHGMADQATRPALPRAPLAPRPALPLATAHLIRPPKAVQPSLTSLRLAFTRSLPAAAAGAARQPPIPQPPIP